MFAEYYAAMAVYPEYLSTFAKHASEVAVAGFCGIALAFLLTFCDKCYASLLLVICSVFLLAATTRILLPGNLLVPISSDIVKRKLADMVQSGRVVTLQERGRSYIVSEVDLVDNRISLIPEHSENAAKVITTFPELDTVKRMVAYVMDTHKPPTAILNNSIRLSD